MRLARILAVTVCLTGITLAGASPASAKTSRWSAFCGQVTAIREANEAPPPSTAKAADRTAAANDRAAVKRLARQYAKLITLSPTSQIDRLLVVVSPVFSHGVTARTPTRAQRAAVRQLDPILLRRCDDESSMGNVFKIVIA